MTPGQARRVVDDIEATLEAEAADRDESAGQAHGDWVPEVPGSGEPPD
jgi:hypothetical protein